ncbi:nucleotide exchange factor GrpE [Candidatus Saccharibacteria bacterium]|nr:nucleotide exchange factor GrpE [Candidatus Saccharibacteria bacterium]
MSNKEPNYKEVAEQLAKENAQLNEALLRERADAMNVRRRAEEDKLKLAGFYKAMVIRDLLPVIDNFERSLKHVPKDLQKNEYIKGIQGVVKQFEQTLEKLGLKRIKTVDEHFDPNLHEAVSMEEGDGNSPAGEETVSEELQSGWMLGDEVLRHAMVRVRS